MSEHSLSEVQEYWDFMSPFWGSEKSHFLNTRCNLDSPDYLERDYVMLALKNIREAMTSCDELIF